MEQVAERLSAASEAYHLGTFSSDRLVGMVSVFRNPRAKSHHKAYLGGMYVLPELRGQGIGQNLLSEAIQRARNLAGLEELVLAVTVGNEQARRLYLSFGFKPYCVEPRYIKLGQHYFDIEWLVLPL